MPGPESRTFVKTNGAWKILNMSIIDNSAYELMNAINNMKAFTGKWEYEDNSFSVQPDDSSRIKTLRFELKETSNGLEQLSDVSYTFRNETYTPPTECELFIPDYNQTEIQYVDIQKNTSGQTSTNLGKVSSNEPNSFTVKSVYPDKPTVVQYEYTVSFKDGKWHQVSKYYGRDGSLTRTFTFDLHRM